MWNIRSLLTSELDDFGRVENEKNRLGLTQNYFYDDEGKLKTQTNFDSAISTIIYSSNRIVRTVRYEDCSENCFVYDVVGNITEAQNAYGKTVYRYDSGARLVYQKDVTTGEEIYFTYDDAGNRTKLLSSNRETSYTYGKNNEVKEIFDNKQRLSVKLQYDMNGRENERLFGNETTEATLYDKAGRVIVKTQNSSRGELLWAEGYLYGEDGKRTATVDNKGRVTLYEYNKKGQLQTVWYPYSQEMINLLKSEAEENGLLTLAELSENRFLPSDIKSGLIPLMNSMQYGLAYSLTNLQIFIKESYGYDKNGNRVSKTTNYGPIEYNYDKENRLLSSGSKGQAYVNYSYDSMGNLLTEESLLQTTKYAYNAQNRLIYCEVTDKSKKEYAQTSYTYDAFGRRVIVQDKPESARFKTVDPIRDGTNWFAYVNNDPVNHIDLWGLCQGKDVSLDIAGIEEIDNPWKTWWNKKDGKELTEEEIKFQKGLGIAEMIVGPVVGGALSMLDPAAFLAGMYLMADGAIVYTSAEDGIKKTPITSIPTTFLVPYVEVNGIILPAGGTFIW